MAVVETVVIIAEGRRYTIDVSMWPEQDKWWKREVLVTRMLEALRLAANQFKDYADQHHQKGTEDGDRKARVNEEMARKCEEALAYDWSRLEAQLFESFNEQDKLYKKMGIAASDKDKAAEAVKFLQKEGLIPSHDQILARVLKD